LENFWITALEIISHDIWRVCLLGS